MAGIFDLFSDDPGQAANMMLAAGLLSGRGSFGQILGNSLAQAQGTYANALDQKQQGKIKSLQTKQIEEQLSAAEELRKRTEEFRRSIPSPEMQASQAALSGGGGPTMANAQRIAPTDPTTSFMFKAMQAGQLSPLDYVKMTQKDNSPIKLGAGEKLLKPGSFATLAENPKDEADKTPNAVREYQFAVGQGYKGSFDQWDQGRRRAGATTVSFGQPVAGVDANGNPVFFQPSKGGGAPAIVPGVRPNPKENITQDERQSAGALTRLESSLATLNQIEKTNPKALSPGLIQEATRNVTEIGANMMTSAARQKVESAQLDALDAALWLATGAAYNKEQLRGLSKSYFPQVGDKPDAIKEKKNRFSNIVETAKVRAGRAALPSVTPQPEAQPGNDPLGLR